VVRNLEKLREYAAVNPDLFPKISRRLERRATSDLRAGRLGHVRVALAALAQLTQCHAKAAPLCAPSLVRVAQAVLQRSDEFRSDPALDDAALELLGGFVSLQTHGSRWWSDQLAPFVPALAALVEPGSAPPARRGQALRVVGLLLGATARDAHLPAGWADLVGATVRSLAPPGPDDPAAPPAAAAADADAAAEAGAVLCAMCAMSPASASRTVEAALSVLRGLGCFADGAGPARERHREDTLSHVRAGLARGGQPGLLFGALVQLSTSGGAESPPEGGLLDQARAEVRRLPPSAAVPALVKALTVLPRAAARVAWGGALHATLAGVARDAAARAAPVLPLLDAVGAAAQQLPPRDQDAAVYALDGMAALLEGGPAAEAASLARRLAAAAGLGPAGAPPRSRALPPPLTRALLSVVAPSRASWNDAARVAALRALGAAAASAEAPLSDLDAEEVCAAVARLWPPRPDAPARGPPARGAAARRPSQLRALGDAFAALFDRRGGALRAPAAVAHAAAGCLAACVARSPPGAFPMYAWLAAHLRSHPGGALSRACAQHVSDRVLDALAARAGLGRRAGAGAVRALRSGCGDAPLRGQGEGGGPEGRRGRPPWGSPAFADWAARGEAAMSACDPAEPLDGAARERWLERLALAMGQAGLGAP